jgi:hypothetical protein
MIEQISYCQFRLIKAGISQEENEFSYSYKGQPKQGPIIEADEADNIQIRFLDPDGNQATYFNGRATIPVIRKRLKVPKGDQKYVTPKGCESFPFIPPLIIQRVRMGLPIETLFITEGEFKAFVACINELPCIGITGIHQSIPAKGQTLHPYIIQIIETCQVKNLVLLFDSDALQVTSNDLELTPEQMIEKDLRKRLLLFASAVKNFKEAGKSLNVDLYFGHIKPENKAKGLDDLFVALPTEAKYIIFDALALSQASQYFNIISLKDNSYNRLNALFGIDSVETFYSLHAGILKSHDFKYGHTIYCHDAASGTVIESPMNYFSFWNVTVEPITNYITVTLDLENLLQFLHDNGFRLYQLGITDYILIRVQNNIVSQISQKDVKEFVRDYVHFQKALSEQVKHCILNVINAYTGLFSMEKLNALRCIEPNFHGDTDKAMFFYFQNGFVVVSKEGIELRNYSELSGYIWKSQILPRAFHAPSDPDEVERFMFARFVDRICSKRKGKAWELDESRLDAFTSLLGYALHMAKKERRALVFTDTEISDNPEGRTGKTIVGKALGKLRVYSEIDGKGFDPTDRFRFQDAHLDTQVLHLNDVGRGKKAFDFELMFTGVTEGIRVEKKGQATFTIRPTVVISSNRALQINGGSARARVIEFEFSNFFSDKYSPKDEFGSWFFDDWNTSQWHLFDYYMLSCAVQYLMNGFVHPDQINLNERKLYQATGNSKHFKVFADENLKLNTPYVKRIVNASFVAQYPEYNTLTAQAFTKWLHAYGAFKGWIVDDGSSKDKDGNRVLVYKTHGKVS